jgi:hypothetical protein
MSSSPAARRLRLVLAQTEADADGQGAGQQSHFFKAYAQGGQRP